MLGSEGAELALALRGSEFLVALACLFQSIEYWRLRHELADDGVWSWTLIRSDFTRLPRWIRGGLESVLAYPRIRSLIALRLCACGWVLMTPSALGDVVLLVTTALLSVRWRGAFNGGSDSMTLLVLGAVTLGRLSLGSAAVLTLASLWYVTVQCLLSYLWSGLAKLSASSWRRGRALPCFLEGAAFTPRRVRGLVEIRPVALALSWGVILWELSSALLLFWPRLSPLWILSAIAFHLLNWWIFGLNRFLFAWVATYPALQYCVARSALALG